MEELTETQKIENNDLFTKEEARRILTFSFYFSQGNPGTQTDIFSYIHFKHPEWRINPQDIQYLAQGPLRAVAKMAEKEMHTVGSNDMADGEGKYQAALSEAYKMQYILNDQSAMLQHERLPKTEDEALLEFLVNIISKEYDIFYEDKGRPRSGALTENEQYSPMKDKYLSHFCYYGLAENSTGIPVYDEFFKDIKQKAQIIFNNIDPAHGLNLIQRRMKTIVDKYNEHHPTMNVSYPQPLLIEQTA